MFTRVALAALVDVRGVGELGRQPEARDGRLDGRLQLPQRHDRHLEPEHGRVRGLHQVRMEYRARVGIEAFICPDLVVPV